MIMVEIKSSSSSLLFDGIIKWKNNDYKHCEFIENNKRLKIKIKNIPDITERKEGKKIQQQNMIINYYLSKWMSTTTTILLYEW